MIKTPIVVVALLLGAVRQAPPPIPVLLELFTSEGCSSCPPADGLLSAIAKAGVPGAQIIPLGLHVDYWDELGWKDPASMPQATARQNAYALALGNGDRIYTPQLVVDGRDEMIGTDAPAIKKAIGKAVAAPHASVALRVDRDGGALIAQASVTDLPSEAIKEQVDVLLAVTEDDVTNVVKRGENAGRTLHHDAVVRSIALIGRLAAPGEIMGRATLDARWRPDHLHAVVFVQGRKSRRIWGAALGRVP
jgi:hypothetical protein